MIQNLDYTAAKTAKKLVGKIDDFSTLERVSTKAIGVMESQGIYGLYLFLNSRGATEKEVAKKVWEELENLAKNTLNLTSNEVALEIVKNRAYQMLVFDLFERTMIYVRFSAKAKGV